MNVRMFVFHFLLIFVVGMTVLRTTFCSFGQNFSDERSSRQLFCELLIVAGSFLATRERVFLVFGIFWLFAVLRSKCLRLKNQPRDSAGVLLDQIILTMRAGYSFETTLEKISWKPTKDQSSEFANALQLCRSKPSQSFKILSSFRRSLRLRNRLIEKQKAISLQAKAQAVVSGFLYIALFVGQVYLQPQFLPLFSTSRGRPLILASLALVLVGIYLVFQISKPKSLNL